MRTESIAHWAQPIGIDTIHRENNRIEVLAYGSECEVHGRGPVTMLPYTKKFQTRFSPGNAIHSFDFLSLSKPDSSLESLWCLLDLCFSLNSIMFHRHHRKCSPFPYSSRSQKVDAFGFRRFSLFFIHLYVRTVGRTRITGPSITMLSCSLLSSIHCEDERILALEKRIQILEAR